jgi:hypothetical protein
LPKGYSTTGETVVAEIDTGLRPNSASQRDSEDFHIGDDVHRDADMACSRLREAFEECETDATELPSFRPLMRGVPAPRYRARAVPRDPWACDTSAAAAPLPFSRARALAAADAPLPAVARAAPARSVRPFLLAAIFFAGTIAGLGGAVAARGDRLGAGAIEQAGSALSSLVHTIAWREASRADGLASRSPALPTTVEISLPTDAGAAMATAAAASHPPAIAMPASAAAIPAPPVIAPTASFALERGDEAMRQRDVIAARRFYEFAASAGVAGAATALARTYDPLYLQQVGVRGVQADTAAALRWYKRASEEGDPAARPR